MPPKTPRRKGKVSTSFRKNKITPIKSGKKFKQTKKKMKKMRKSICNSSFSPSHLSQSTVSTPIGVRGVVGKRKAAPISLLEQSLLISGAGDDTIKNVREDVTEPVAKKARVDLRENEVKTKDIGDMFRNPHAVEQGLIASRSSFKPTPTVMGQGDKEVEIIVIDDDDEEQEENAHISAVEELGQEMLKLVEDVIPETELNIMGKTVPDTPRTVIKKLAIDKHNLNNTIVLDDTADEDLLLVDNEDNWPTLPAPLKTANLQDVIKRYPGKPADFIPLGGGSRKRGGRHGRNRREERGGIRGGYDGGPLFTVGAPNPQFIGGGGCSTQPRVFRFTGTGGRRREEMGNVVSVGPTMYVGEKSNTDKGKLRPIVIDGSNVAMAHGRDTVFSSKGIEFVVKYFSERGHEKIVAFVPQYRSKPSQSTDRELLERMHKAGHLVFTPSREVGNVRITSYDDAFILDYAAMHGGIVITRDNYRDLFNEKSSWREVVEKRILMPTFIGDDLMFPHDPLGRNGPTLDQFLCF